MARFETIYTATELFGTNSYLEFAVRELTDEQSTKTRFAIITRGFIDDQGEPRWTRFVTVPLNADLLDGLANELRDLADSVRAEAPAAVPT